MDIKCSDPRHAARSSEPDWKDVVAQGNKPIDGLLCRACARIRPQESAVDENAPELEVAFRRGGVGIIRVPIKYSATGDTIGIKEKEFSVAARLNAQERQALASIRDKVVAWLRSQ